MKTNQRVHVTKATSNISSDFGRNQEQMIHDHLETYRLTLPAVLKKLFFPPNLYPKAKERQKCMDAALTRLVKQKKLQRHKLPSGERYYTKAGGLDPSGVAYDLATLWFSTMLPGKRYERISYKEVKSVLGENAPSHHIRHCVTRSAVGRELLVSIYPTTAKSPKQTVQQLKKKIAKAKQTVLPMLERGDYAFAVLSDEEAKRSAIEKAIKERKDDTAPLIEQVRILTATVPTPENLHLWTNPKQSKSDAS